MGDSTDRIIWMPFSFIPDNSAVKWYTKYSFPLLSFAFVSIEQSVKVIDCPELLVECEELPFSSLSSDEPKQPCCVKVKNPANSINAIVLMVFFIGSKCSVLICGLFVF